MTWILPKQLHTLASALDTEALNLDSSEQSQICAQSLFVRSKPSQSRIWSAKWKRDSWTQHLSGRILRPSLGERFATAWTSSLGATHASPSAQQGSAKESKTRGTSGHGLQMAFDFSDPGSVSLRTSKDISAWGCPTSSKTWQEWVIERRGAYSQRLNAERRINASGCSSWPSPVASEVRQGFQDRSRGMKGSQESLTTVVVKDAANWPTPRTNDDTAGRPNDGTARVGPNGQRYGINLSDKVLHGPAVPASWPTPMQMDHWMSNNPRTDGRQEQLPNAVAKYGPAVPASSSTDGSRPGLWQTATVLTGAHRQKDGSMINKLDQQVKKWPTPASSTGNGGAHGLDGGSGARSMLSEQDKQSMKGGKLNARWVEILMNLPVGWTMPSCASPVTIERMNSDSSVTVLSRQQQNEPSEH